MKYTFRENLSDRSGVISNLHGFLNRNLDTGFKSKWSGYWVPPYKFLDYYAIKVNGIWLDPDTLEATEYGDEMVFHHRTDSLKVEEKVSTPERLPGFKVTLTLENTTDEPKALHALLEPGLDIREKSEDIGPEDYEVETTEERLQVAQGDRKIAVSSQPGFTVEGGRYTKDHYPGDRQRCFVPGQLDFRIEIGPEDTKKIEIDFKTGDPVFGSIEPSEAELNHPDLGMAFNDSVTSLENLIYNRKGKGIVAGHPWFQSYWARDAFWSMLGLIDAGHFELVEEILENYADRGLPGKIELGENSDDFPRSDTAPLFVIAADKLERHYELSQKLKEAEQEALDHLDIDGELVEHDPEGTWMDTLERGNAVDLQSLWLEAAKITRDERRDLLKMGLKEFNSEEYMLDSLEDNAPRTINPAVPLMFGQLDEENAGKYLSKINAEFSSRYGARTRSMADPGYDAGGYHTGSVWGLTTGWAAAANLRYGKIKQGQNFLEKMASMIDRYQPGALPEVVDAETGQLMGCPEQAWSAGMLVHVIDTYLLGIKVEDNKVVVDPAGEVSCERLNKRIGDENLDLKFERGEVEILNDPDIEVEIR